MASSSFTPSWIPYHAAEGLKQRHHFHRQYLRLPPSRIKWGERLIYTCSFIYKIARCQKLWERERKETGNIFRGQHLAQEQGKEGTDRGAKGERVPQGAWNNFIQLNMLQLKSSIRGTAKHSTLSSFCSVTKWFFGIISLCTWEFLSPVV